MGSDELMDRNNDIADALAYMLMNKDKTMPKQNRFNMYADYIWTLLQLIFWILIILIIIAIPFSVVTVVTATALQFAYGSFSFINDSGAVPFAARCMLAVAGIFGAWCSLRTAIMATIIIKRA